MILISTPDHCQSLSCPGQRSQGPFPKNPTLSAPNILSSSPACLPTIVRREGPMPQTWQALL